jgi:4-oxalocrotonate tautomerase family enzyme
MPQIILHLCSSISGRAKAELVHSVREAIPRILGTPDRIGQVVLYETPVDQRAAHASRDARFAIVVAMMYPGRTPDQKRTLMREIMRLITLHTGVSEADINAVIHEIPAENYFGGTGHAYIEEQRRGG